MDLAISIHPRGIAAFMSLGMHGPPAIQHPQTLDPDDHTKTAGGPVQDVEVIPIGDGSEQKAHADMNRTKRPLPISQRRGPARYAPSNRPDRPPNVIYSSEPLGQKLDVFA